MSITAVVWAQDDAPHLDDDPIAVAVLVAYARSADEHGKGAYPGIDTLMRRTRLSDRTVQRKTDKLLDLGLIRPGDQSLVAHLPANLRPPVVDVAVELRRPPAEGGRREKKRQDRKHDRAEVIVFLVGRDGPGCRGCGLIPDDVLTLQVDHVTPRALGGGHTVANFQLLCGPCNLDKRAKHPDVWRAGLAANA